MKMAELLPINGYAYTLNATIFFQFAYSTINSEKIPENKMPLNQNRPFQKQKSQ